jgi:hypothetical protein
VTGIINKIVNNQANSECIPAIVATIAGIIKMLEPSSVDTKIPIPR